MHLPMRKSAGSDRRRVGWLLAGVILLPSGMARADGPGDNRPATVRPIPPPGIDLPAERRKPLESQLAKLNSALDSLAARHEARVDALLPDVRIYAKAVHD